MKARKWMNNKSKKKKEISKKEKEVPLSLQNEH